MVNTQKTVNGIPVPDDIWQSAVMLVGSSSGDTDFERRLVAEGIMVERARCAALARVWMKANGPFSPMHNAGMRQAAEFIASDIEGAKS